ncbi:hypothetical protein [Amycolatopsis jejuensis]|uniref:hypothetical protein n=1 Tax=Amycolatopsis jejuensis TaxID=330084 RepID=UPI0012E00AAF|nr:hypothetical protein [Amycolatopsis jejuensis]
MTRRSVTLACLATLACALTACDSAVDGAPKPAPSASAPASSSAQADTPLAGMSSCATLDKALTGQGFPAAAPSPADPEHVCTSVKGGTGTYGLLLQDGQTIEENIQDVSQTAMGHVNKRRAILERNLNGTQATCGVRMEILPRSRAIVTAFLTTGSTDQACEAAKNLAGVVEPLLPPAR